MPSTKGMKSKASTVSITELAVPIPDSKKFFGTVLIKEIGNWYRYSLHVTETSNMYCIGCPKGHCWLGTPSK